MGNAGASNVFSPDILLVISTRRMPCQFFPPLVCLILFMLNSLWCCKCLRSHPYVRQKGKKKKTRPNPFSFIQSILSLMSFFSRNLLQPLWRLEEVLGFSTHACVKNASMMDLNIALLSYNDYKRWNFSCWFCASQTFTSSRQKRTRSRPS